MKKILISLMAILLAFGAVSGCKNKVSGSQPVKGTLEKQLGTDSMPKAVSIVLKVAEKTTGDERFECIMEDKENGIGVWGLMKCNDTISSEGYGRINYP